MVEATVYIDGGMFETTYTRPTGGAIDANLHYNSLIVKDPSTALRPGGSSQIATIRVGTNTPDSTPAVKYYLADHLENSNVVLRTNGSLVNREEYYPFGETSFGSYKYKRYRYNGKEKDEHTGLYEYGQRYYAPWLCRFLSVDPIAEDYPQLSSYNYAGNKPITAIDIEGLQSSEDTEVGGTTQAAPSSNETPTFKEEFLQDESVSGVKGNSDTEIQVPDALSVDMSNAENLLDSGNGSATENSLIELVFDDIVQKLEELDRLLYPDGGIRYTSENSKDSDAAALKRNYDSSKDITWIEDILSGLGKNPKALDASKIDRLVEGIGAAAGATNETLANKDLIKQKAQEFIELLTGVRPDSTKVADSNSELKGSSVDSTAQSTDSIRITYRRVYTFEYNAGNAVYGFDKKSRGTGSSIERKKVGMNEIIDSTYQGHSIIQYHGW